MGTAGAGLVVGLGGVVLRFCCPAVFVVIITGFAVLVAEGEFVGHVVGCEGIGRCGLGPPFGGFPWKTVFERY